VDCGAVLEGEYEVGRVGLDGLDGERGGCGRFVPARGAGAGARTADSCPHSLRRGVYLTHARWHRGFRVHAGRADGDCFSLADDRRLSGYQQTEADDAGEVFPRVKQTVSLLLLPVLPSSEITKLEAN